MPAASHNADTLTTRLQTLLPDLYEPASTPIQPTPMGSAGLKFAPNGAVAWNEMWRSFCHLAMAGGPPHKGRLLQPATASEILKDPGRYRQVTEEIRRGITLVTNLEAQPSRTPGWVRVECANPTMAGWLLRAITMENVAVQCAGAALLLPAGPAYRLEKEIKNVITVLAKTCHYWRDHTTRPRQQAIANLFVAMELERPLIQPGRSRIDQSLFSKFSIRLLHETGLEVSPLRYPGWLGVECKTIRTAIELIRALVASNILARREETTLFVPFATPNNPEAECVPATLAQLIRMGAHL